MYTFYEKQRKLQKGQAYRYLVGSLSGSVVTVIGESEDYLTGEPFVIFEVYMDFTKRLYSVSKTVFLEQTSLLPFS